MQWFLIVFSSLDSLQLLQFSWQSWIVLRVCNCIDCLQSVFTVQNGLKKHGLFHMGCFMSKKHIATKGFLDKQNKKSHIRETLNSQRLRIVAPIPKRTETDRKRFFLNVMSCVRSHVSGVTCQVSRVTCLVNPCHLSPVTNANCHSHRPSTT